MRERVALQSHGERDERQKHAESPPSHREPRVASGGRAHRTRKWCYEGDGTSFHFTDSTPDGGELLRVKVRVRGQGLGSNQNDNRHRR